MAASATSPDSRFRAFDIVVIGASLGGIEALKHVLQVVPPDFPVPIAIVQHLSPTVESAITRILARACPLPIAHPSTGEALLPGRVYVARPDRHFLVRPAGTAMLTNGAKVKFCRPAADPLFVSAAAAYGERALGVVLSGLNTDGAAGVQAIKWAGGMVLAQAADSCVASSMPRAAIATGCVDLVLPLDGIGPAIIALTLAPGAADFLRVPMQAA
jgi:two-component system, chemotaxis family, protein-glutamate methylesterase/glutaminase